jgi:uroporphyrinogen-III decarboxylase
MTAMIDTPHLFTFVADRYAEGDERRMREWADAGVEAVFIADGWASADIISPEFFRRFALPYQQSIIDAAHDQGLKVILWNEGDVMPILQDERKLRWDAFAMEQSRKGFVLEVSDLRQAIGPERCIMGNIDSETLLVSGSCEEIEKAVLEQHTASGMTAPFIHSTGSPLPSDVPPEHVDAMLQAAWGVRSP